MDEKIIITVFTDPMMGLSYESEPVRERLEAAFGGKIAFEYVMSLFVRDVADFMLPEELALGRAEGIARYNKRLSAIYKSEEKIGGLPINMDGFSLFSAEHPSSLPLNLAFHAAKIAAPEKADDFLHNLRRATIVETRMTTRTEELAAVAEKTGIDRARFLSAFEGEEAKAALEKDLALTKRLGIRGLPAYLVSCGKKSVLIKGLAQYEHFVTAIGEVSDGKLKPIFLEPDNGDVI